ncbi:MAG TPA: GntR family transcriptional regulator [Streptosporangiaceae bacterium]|nr:GntR family transcriptional regulator [Streptosporangiaceae bacterium]
MDARSNEVAAQLQTAILDGSYLPGEPLREAALADRYAVSRRTIREALLVLADQGLAIHRHNSGACVRRFTADDIADLYRVRRILECEGARRAPNADESQLALVGKAYDVFASAASQGVRSVALAQADAAFHGAVIGLAGSRQIADFYERIGAQMTYAICLVQRREHELAVKRDVILAEHRAIADAISNRDVFEAQGLILAHIATHERNAQTYWSVQQ